MLPQPEAERKAVLKRLLAAVARHWSQRLAAHPPAVRYLIERGISGATAKRFGLGWSDQKWQGMDEVMDHYLPSDGDQAGLFVQGQDESRYDRFRGRIMFPITGADGQLMGFGGRALDTGDDRTPKYLNSPEGPLFRKRESLFGLAQAVGALQAGAPAFLMEGYTDVLAASQAGFAGALGCMGTALTTTQVQIVLQLTRRVYLCFDGDRAGQRAAADALTVIVPLADESCTFRFVLLPPHHDPDSLIAVEGKQAFEAAVGHSLTLLQFIQLHSASGCDMRYAEGRARYAHRLRTLWAIAPETSGLRAQLKEDAANVLAISEDSLSDLWY